MTSGRWLSRQEAAVRLGVPVETVDRLIRLAVLDRYVLNGLYIRVLASQVDELASVDPDVLRHA